MRRKPRRVRRLHAKPRGSNRRANPSEASYQSGYEAGYHQGVQAGYSCYDTLFEGTSIIIPSYNQANYLKSCIESIMENTELPYEIIVVDNASTDHTADYLKSLNGQVRFRVLPQNYGFAGAVNAGLMMAKGTTLLILNNDTLVTLNWLENLMICLNSDPHIGMVGPVTNYISGDQQISVSYQDIEEMAEFARMNNVSDPKRWQHTDRLPGFCLLFRRELFEKTGFLDEGFEVGNFEDDDFNVRVRLQGYSLVIAKDSFIHHFGSVSMKALGEQLEEINNRNMVFYMNKWGNPYEWIHQLKDGLKHMAEPSLIEKGERAFYPEAVAVKGTGDRIFWIENGVRRPIEGVWNGAVVRIPQVQLRRWPIGDALSEVEAAAVWTTIQDDSTPFHGKVARGMDGYNYYLEHGFKRKIITEAAEEGWALHLRAGARLTAEQISALPEGLPLIPAIKLRQAL
ncbi:glycosyltransferase family 2 protein [Paenibacillus sp. NPDC058071]|uniref:glycosyltransferase family 2 protein n=1 Tax=Paenibacillus sp. NPDC058071 TaxID=3346326 RepID=UPI0036DBD123